MSQDTINVKAWAIHSADEDKLQPYEFTLEAKTLGDTEVDIEVFNSGLCHTDYHMMKNDWGITTYPLVPGHEGVGKVIRKGSKVESLNNGDIVGVGWIADSCKACPKCKVGNENLCNYTGLIVNGNGCFASHVRLDERFATKIPDGTDLRAVGPLFCAGTTVFAPLKQYMNVPGIRVGVIGIGGLGHLAVQFAAKMGGEVTAISRTRGRQDYFEKLGATHTIATEEEGAFEKNAGKLDLIINCSPTVLDWEKYVSLLTTGGKFVLCGVPSNDEKDFNLPYSSIIFRQITIAGSIVAGSVDTQDTVRCATLYNISPSVETLPMSQINTAIERMLKGDFKENAFRFVLEN